MNIRRTVGLLSLLTFCGAASAEPVINNNNQRVTLNLRGEGFVVNGNNNTIRLRGQCGTLTVNGNRNVVTLDAVRSVITNGNRNKISWKKGARVSGLGSYNTLTGPRTRRR